VLTKYQAEKKVPWYHWEVVDAGTLNTNDCNCISEARTGGANRDSSKSAKRTIYKPAPEGSCLGDKLEVSKEERVKLAAMFEIDVADSDTKLSDGIQRQ